MTMQPGQSTSLPRGVCPVCERDVALRVGGQLREHRDSGGELCVASGYGIDAAENAAQLEIAALRRMSR